MGMAPMTDPNDLLRRQRDHEQRVDENMASLEARICEYVDARLAHESGVSDREARLECVLLTMSKTAPNWSVTDLISFADAVAAVVPLPAPETLSSVAPEATYIAEVGRYENVIITSPRTYAIFRSMVGDAMGRVDHFPRLSDLMRKA